MTRRGRLAGWAGAVIAALCLLAAVSTIAVLRSEWFRNQVRLRIIQELESATGGRAEIGEFRFDRDRMSAEVRALVLHGKEPEGEQPLLRADSVSLGLKIISILRRDVDLQSLVIRKPRLRVVVNPDGSTNLPQPAVARRRTRPVEQFLALAIEDFRIEAGELLINERRTPIDVAGEDLNTRLAYEAAGPRYSGALSFRRLRLSSNRSFNAALDADVALSLEADRLILREAAFRTQRSSAKLTGLVQGLVSPRLNAGVKARISLAEAQSMAGMPVSAHGMLDLAADLRFAGVSDYTLSGRVSGAGLSADIGGAALTGAGLESDLKLGPIGLELSGLSLSGLGGKFAGSAGLDRQLRFRVAGTAESFRLSELASLRRLQPPPWDAFVSGPVSVEGSLAGGAAHGVELTGRFGVEPADPSHPLRGFVSLTFDQRAGALIFDDSHLVTAASSLHFSGTPQERLQVDLETRDLGDLLSAAAYLDPSMPRELPVSLRDGTAGFKGTVTGGTSAPRASGHVTAKGFVWEGRAFDRLEADLAASSSALALSGLLLEQGGARAQGQARLTLENWKLARTGPASGAFEVRGLSLERALAEAGRKEPLGGTVAGSLQLGGTPAELEIGAKLVVKAASFRGQPVDEVRVRGRYSARSLLVESLEADAGPARVRASGVYTHRETDWRAGSLRFEASGKGVRVADLRAVSPLPEELGGTLDVQLTGTGTVEGGRLLLAGLSGKGSFRKATWEGKAAGDLQFTAESRNGEMTLTATGAVLGSEVRAEGNLTLRDKYPYRGRLTFSRTSLSEVRPWFGAAAALPPVEATADGAVYVTGSALEPGGWTAQVELPGVEILPPPDTKAQGLGLRNVGLVVLSVNRKSVRIVSASFTGPDTNIQMSGAVDLVNRFNAYDLRLRGRVNLGILRNFDPSLSASGETALDATVRGPRSKPEFYGKLEFRGASFYLSNVPNGLENATGVVLLSRNRATIEKLTAETGGGKLALKGFVSFGAPPWSFGLQASAANVRVRYPQGVSTSLDASLTLTGTSSSSLVGGTVTILRSGVSPEVDLAALFSSAAQPLVTPATRNELLRGMQFDVRVAAAPNARVDTMLTRNVQAEAEMRLRGTPYKPVLLGRINVNQGEVNFLGNRYSISRGEISFLNPVRLEPVLSLDLETRVRGIDVTLSFTGPADRMNLSYRSDPPLQLQEIIALLALGRAPTSDPALLARQSDQEQSWSQVGANTLVGQALDAAVTSRVQRFFGVSRIKIDPRLTGLANKPGAQITLEQQISRDITFTYVTSLAQEQQQLVRVEWNVSRQWSLVAVREENGLLGVEVQFRRQFK
ncbi:MAG: translocation/assembly module TamB domain-containing protein [Bryobacterales bacterium]|nr:translocation/assembly module TamB domain-containing protein [Bryobacterales bacterium]